jgi:hypothetical protein
MKYIHIFLNEFKTKWSTKLLVGIFALVVSSIFASNFILKTEYTKFLNLPKIKKNKYANYLTLSDKPFKHLKIENGNAIGRIILEQNNTFSLLYSDSDAFKSSQHNFIEGVKVDILNDTLIIKIETKYEKIQSSEVDNIHINASKLLSVTCIDSELEIDKLNQKVFNAFLWGKSQIDVSRDSINTDLLNVDINGFSNFLWLNDNSFQTVNAQLNKGAQLDLGRVNVKKLNFNQLEGTSIKLSSETLMNLMKK